MKCPKCGYHSFDHLDACKKCSNDLTAHKAKYNLHGFYSPEQSAGSSMADAPAEVDEEAPQESAEGNKDVDFGFDFLDEEEPEAQPAAPAGVQLGDDTDSLSLDQPFGIDGESVPADEDEEKKDPGSEFGF